MRFALLRKSVREAQLLLAASFFVMFGFCWMRVWLVSLLPTDRFRTIVEQFREFERFVPVPFEQLFTYPGRIALTYDELIVVMCVVIWAIARGSDCIAGELGRGTMEMVLAQPVSRRHLVVSQALVTLLGVALLALASWAGIYVGIQTTHVDEPVSEVTLNPLAIPAMMNDPAQALAEGETREVSMSEKVSPQLLWPATVNLFSLGVFLAGLSTLVSAFDCYRWRTIGIVAAIYVVQLIMKIVGLAAEQWAWLLKFTFFTAYDPEKFVSVAVNAPSDVWSLVMKGEDGTIVLGPLGSDLLLFGLGIGAYLVAMFVFQRRDLPAPV